ncbi:HlyD family type I secretion periplasmic adaptor subunit [Spiribacter vilamensis]|uniref:Membrane fusion protein (MFP) family protein n=1 Tax=Spiribacter vilamensis TaxID=531306 RepID=A0A4Q8D0R1_9GAMM|nr:HlyD family type I secretion periplasmic adaptor subunit [Spiribacter vilamensis]RZU98916.1 adhesin transport system membrane fusion protein [Spiribacter vilamensis]TVO62074.1 HlyD family type I secretion periplasmic adaptor subunit [Spiribacter vilamensis]
MSGKQRRTLEQRGFEGVGKLAGQRRGEDSGGRADAPRGDGRPGTWAAQAGWAQLQQTPLRARLLLYGMLLTLIALIVWAGWAELDQVVRGQGQVIPSRKTQLVQSLDGGTVSRILVEEGDRVEQGELLVEIDSTRSVSSLRENQAKRYALRAEVARLEALTQQTSLDFAADLERNAPDIVVEERQLFESSRQELNEQLSVQREKLEQRRQDLSEARAAYEQHRRALELTRRELRVTRPLLNSGAVSPIDVIRLEREEANTLGERTRAESAIARAESAIEEANRRLDEIRLNAFNRWRNERADASARLDALQEAAVGLVDRVEQTAVRAPRDGVVQRLFVNTVGGVISPGREILEITPSNDELLVEARIDPKDIALLRRGLPATLKFGAYDFTRYGGLDGELTHISSDTITDDDDNTFYQVRLKTPQTGFSEDQPILPGMTAEVDIITGERTVLEYLLKPVLRGLSRSMSQP